MQVLLRFLVAASAVLLFLGLDASTIWDANEAYYVETPRQMVESGDYVNPSFNARPRFNKPVLSYWIVAGFYKIFGIAVWAERVAIALGALGIAAAAFVIARVVWSARAGWIAALVLLTAPRVVFFARRIFIDVWITMFMSLVLMFFVLAEARPKQRRRYLLLMYAAAGLGMLTKGPVAVVLPGIALFLYLFSQRRLRDIRRMYLLTGTLIVLAIVAPWYVMVYAEHGWAYIREFFIAENIGRYAETFGHQDRSMLFYVPVLLTELFPWSLFVPAALFVAWRRANPPPVICGTPFVMEKRENDGFLPARKAAVSRILLWWIAAIVLVFTFSRTKQDLYIFPIAAALAVLIAALLDDAIESLAPAATAVRWTWPVLAVVLLGVWILFQQLFGTVESPYFIRGAFFVGLFMLAGAFTILAYWRKRQTMEAILALGLAFVLANYMMVLVSLPHFERFKPVAPLSAAANARNARAHIVQFRTSLPSMVWYLGRPIEEVLDVPVLRERLARPEETLVVLTATDYPELQTLGPTCVVARHPLFNVKIRQVAAGTAPPEVLLVSNRCDER